MVAGGGRVGSGLARRAGSAMVGPRTVRERCMLEKKAYPVPLELDEEIARLKLQSMGVRIDRLTKEQEKYLNSWDVGT